MRAPILLTLAAFAALLIIPFSGISGVADATSNSTSGASSQEFTGEWTQDESGCWEIILADGRKFAPQPVAGLSLYPELSENEQTTYWFTGEIQPENAVACGEAAIVISDAWKVTNADPDAGVSQGGEDELNNLLASVVPLVGIFALILLTIGVVGGDESVQYAALKRAGRKSGRTADAIFLRGRIMGFLSANEGLHFSGLSQAFGMGNHQTAHHLSQLEEEGHVWSQRDGRKLRFYTNSVAHNTSSLPVPIDLPSIESVQARILVYLEAVESGQFKGTKQADIALQIGSSQQLVSHHLKTLIHRGWVLQSGRGRNKVLHLTLAGSEALQRIRTDDNQPPMEASFSHDFQEIVG